MNNDQTYQDYASYFVKDVSDTDLRHLVALFMYEAAINMGSVVVDEVIDRTILYIRNECKFIPVSYIASAFVRGSLGKIGDGKGRLIPKTILMWIGETSLDYNRALNAQREKDKRNEVSIAMDLHKYPVGSAIGKKIDWYRKGLLKMSDWDNVPLKDIAEKISKGVYVTPEMFGINVKT